jgi:hypothetical protein
MLVRQVAITTNIDSSSLPPGELAKLAASLQLQATRDFGPLWGVDATVSAYDIEDVPMDAWPVIIVDQLPPGEGGVHEDEHGQPFALVLFNEDYTLSASHETLEMLADPFGRRFVGGPSIDPASSGNVRYLLEVCDPCEGKAFSYEINGVRVSDFITKQYHSPEGASQGGRYSFTGAIRAPRQVLDDGYISWQDSSGTWHQAFNQNGKMSYKTIGTTSAGNLREQVHGLAAKAGIRVAPWFHAAPKGKLKRRSAPVKQPFARAWLHRTG